MQEKTDSQRPETGLLQEMAEAGHEQVVHCSRPQAGLRAIIAIHDTTLGPSLGGVRMWPYRSGRLALDDVLRLSKAMTYKAAVAGLNLGGGKAVIIGDSRTDKTEAMFRALGRFVEGLGGRYIAAEDVGMEERDMAWMRRETRYVTGLPKSDGGIGNPSPVTAHGVYVAMKAACGKAFGSESLDGRRIAIQGAGNVAAHLARRLAREGARITLCDLHRNRADALAEETGAQVVEADGILDVEADVFSPCALGGVLDDDTVGRLRAAVVVGGANNVLADPDRHAQALAGRGVLLVPDFVANAGGIMHVSCELEGREERHSYERAEAIHATVLRVLTRAEEEGITTTKAAERLAEERIRAVGGLATLRVS